MNPKILIFCPLPPIVTGGIEEYAYSVVEAILSSKAFQVTVVTSKFNDGKMYPLDCDKYFYIPSIMLFKRPVPRNVVTLLRLIKLIKNSDLIHIHMSYPILESFAATIAKILGKKIIVTYHADAKIDKEESSMIAKLFFSLIERLYVLASATWPLLFSDLICTNTLGYTYSSKVLMRYIKKVKVVHQGIRRDLFNFFSVSRAKEIRVKFLTNEYSYLITFIGRLVPYKGLRYLIEAANILRTKYENIIFVIGGIGPEKERLLCMVKEKNLQNVLLIGFVKDEDLFNIFAASDLVISPSVSNLESTPISLLCALSVGTPVIGTEVGGTSETIPNDGVRGSIIPICDSVALAENISKMLDSKRCSPIPHPKVRFWSDVANDYMILFRKFLNQTDKKMREDVIGL